VNGTSTHVCGVVEPVYPQARVASGVVLAVAHITATYLPAGAHRLLRQDMAFGPHVPDKKKVPFHVVVVPATGIVCGIAQIAGQPIIWHASHVDEQ
jgi:hypothetical protein